MSPEENCQDLVSSYFQRVEKCGWNHEDSKVEIVKWEQGKILK